MRQPKTPKPKKIASALEPLYKALKAGPIQPWQRDVSFPHGPEVGANVCMGCLPAYNSIPFPHNHKPGVCDKAVRP